MLEILKYIDIGEGETIVFIHGLGSHKGYWEPQHELSDTYRLIIPDLRGHGDTEIDDNLTPYNFAEDIIDLLQKLEIKSAYICGISLGGFVAQEIYKQRPDIIKGLILCNTSFYIPIFIGNYIVNKSSKLFYKDKNKLIEQILLNDLRDKTYIEEAKRTFYIRDTYLDSARSFIGCNYYSTLSRINKPTMLISSWYDNVCPIFNTYQMKYLIPHAEIEILNAGHLSSFEKRDEFNLRVRKFIG